MYMIYSAAKLFLTTSVVDVHEPIIEHCQRFQRKRFSDTDDMCMKYELSIEHFLKVSEYEDFPRRQCLINIKLVLTTTLLHVIQPIIEHCQRLKAREQVFLRRRRRRRQCCRYMNLTLNTVRGFKV